MSKLGITPSALNVGEESVCVDRVADLGYPVIQRLSCGISFVLGGMAAFLVSQALVVGCDIFRCEPIEVLFQITVGFAKLSGALGLLLMVRGAWQVARGCAIARRGFSSWLVLPVTITTAIAIMLVAEIFLGNERIHFESGWLYLNDPMNLKPAMAAAFISSMTFLSCQFFQTIRQVDRDAINRRVVICWSINIAVVFLMLLGNPTNWPVIESFRLRYFIGVDQIALKDAGRELIDSIAILTCLAQMFAFGIHQIHRLWLAEPIAKARYLRSAASPFQGLILNSDYRVAAGFVCGTCRYEIRGLRLADACPECGVRVATSFNEENAATISQSQLFQFRWVSVAAGAGFSLLLISGSFLILARQSDSNIPNAMGQPFKRMFDWIFSHVYGMVYCYQEAFVFGLLVLGIGVWIAAKPKNGIGSSAKNPASVRTAFIRSLLVLGLLALRAGLTLITRQDTWFNEFSDYDMTSTWKLYALALACLWPGFAKLAKRQRSILAILRPARTGMHARFFETMMCLTGFVYAIVLFNEGLLLINSSRAWGTNYVFFKMFCRPWFEMERIIGILTCYVPVLTWLLGLIISIELYRAIGTFLTRDGIVFDTTATKTE